MKIYCDSDVLGRKLPYLKTKERKILALLQINNRKLIQCLVQKSDCLKIVIWYNKFQTSI